ncbi:MAG: hypothetical protein B6I38_04640 [Anaerolineaceae bacterium 4572_5.1]|nr:MAG: hypothetical protein B6I38_04640 [Anaerolineaceae bacterium 4572_5.1]RLD05241.1 MAG: hypothetical protein DRI56_10030 [Chloroflexota bacterium]
MIFALLFGNVFSLTDYQQSLIGMDMKFGEGKRNCIGMTPNRIQVTHLFKAHIRITNIFLRISNIIASPHQALTLGIQIYK